MKVIVAKEVSVLTEQIREASKSGWTIVSEVRLVGDLIRVVLLKKSKDCLKEVQAAADLLSIASQRLIAVVQVGDAEVQPVVEGVVKKSRVVRKKRFVK